MKIRNNWNFFILLLLLIYLILRLSSLLTIPFMQDEAEYLFWAKTMLADPTQYLISLYEGKTPLYIWLQIPFLLTGTILEIHEARMVSLVSGLFSMLALYLLSVELFKNKKIGALAVVIFILFPYAQIYNSVSVFEGTVGTFILFTLLFSIKLVKKPKLTFAIAFGVLMGLGILTKRQAYFNLYLLPFSFLFFPFKKTHLKKLRYLIILVFIAIAIAIIMQQFLKTSEYFERIAWMEGGTVYTKRSWLMMPLSQKVDIFSKNSISLVPVLISYLTLPYLLLIGFSLSLYKKYWRALIILLAYFLIPVTTLLVFGTRAAEHWAYPMTLTLIPLIALGLYEFTEKAVRIIKKKYKHIEKIRYGIYAFFLLYPALFITMIVFSPLSSPLNDGGKYQYYLCHMEIFLDDIPRLNKAAKHKKILIGTENDKGFKNFMATNLWGNKNILVKGYWPKDHELPHELEVLSKKMPIYFATLIRGGDRWYIDKLQANVPVKMISKKTSPNNGCIYRLYKVN